MTTLGSLVWALWVVSGGRVNSGYLEQPQIVAYFETQAECVRVSELVRKLSEKKNQCIQARYVIK